jgi:hypothetical protein
MDITVSTGQRFFTEDIAKVDFNAGRESGEVASGSTESEEPTGPSLAIVLKSGEEIRLFDEEAMIVLSLLPKQK